MLVWIALFTVSLNFQWWSRERFTYENLVSSFLKSQFSRSKKFIKLINSCAMLHLQTLLLFVYRGQAESVPSCTSEWCPCHFAGSLSFACGPGPWRASKCWALLGLHIWPASEKMAQIQWHLGYRVIVGRAGARVIWRLEECQCLLPDVHQWTGVPCWCRYRATTAG